MLTIRTRSTNKDYDSFFTPDDISWNEYRELYNEATPLFVFVEISELEWKGCLGYIPSDRKTAMNSAISYTSIAGRGLRGNDEDAKAFYCFVAAALGGGDITEIETSIKNLAPEFDRHFDAHFIDSLDSKRQTTETEEQVNARLLEISKTLKVPPVKARTGKKQNDVEVVLLSASSRDNFLENLAFVSTTNGEKPVPVKKLVLVCTTKRVSKEVIEQAFCKNFIGRDVAIYIFLKEAPKNMKLPYKASINKSALRPVDNSKKKRVLTISFLALVFVCSILGNIYLLLEKKSQSRLRDQVTSLQKENSDLNKNVDSLKETSAELKSKKDELDKKVDSLEKGKRKLDIKFQAPGVWISEDGAITMHLNRMTYTLEEKGKGLSDSSSVDENMEFEEDTIILKRDDDTITLHKKE